MATVHVLRDLFLETHLRSLFDHLADLPEDVRTNAALAAASEVLEFAAYELAKSDDARHVSRLILLAADLERTSVQLRSKALGAQI